jgi:hypothetical protein
MDDIVQDEFPDQVVTPESEQLAGSELTTVLKTLYMVIFIFVGISDGFLIGYKASLIAIFTERKVPSEKRAILNVVVLMYVLRMFVAPITDRYFLSFIGKRKTYLLPCKLFQSLICFLASAKIDEWVNDGSLWTLSSIFFMMNIIGLFEYNALVGLRLDYFGQAHASLAASSATIGVFLGVVLGLQVFTALNSKDVCLKYFGKDHAILSHRDLLLIVAGIYLASFLILSFMREKELDATETLDTVHPWRTVQSLFKVEPIKNFLIWNFFGPSLVFSMKITAGQYYIAKGVKREDIVILVALVTLPVSILSNLVWVKIASGRKLMFLLWLGVLMAAGVEMLEAVNYSFFDKNLNYRRTLVCICVITSLDALANWWMIQGTFLMTSAPKKYTLTYISTINSMIIAFRAIPIGTINALMDYFSMPILFAVCLTLQLAFHYFTLPMVRSIDETDPKTLGEAFVAELEASEAVTLSTSAGRDSLQTPLTK